MRLGEMARIETGFVGAGRSFDPGGLGMLRREKLGELWTENRERRHSEQRGQVARTGIVADEAGGARERGQELIDIAQRVIDPDHIPARGPQPGGDLGEAFDGPETHGMAGARVDYDAARRGGGGRGTRGEKRQIPTERGREGAPMLGAMGARGAGKWLSQQHSRACPGKPETAPGPGQGEDEMVARIRTGGNSEIKTSGAQFTSRADKLAPRPAVEVVFAPEGRPRRGERHEFDFRREANEQRSGVRLGQQADACVRGCEAEKRHGQRKIAKAPQLSHEQAWKFGDVRRFCQAHGVKF